MHLREVTVDLFSVVFCCNGVTLHHHNFHFGPKILGVWVLQSESNEEIKAILRGVNRRLQLLGCDTVLVYTDKCCQDSPMLTEVFASLGNRARLASDAPAEALPTLTPELVGIPFIPITTETHCNQIFEGLVNDADQIMCVGFDLEWTPEPKKLGLPDEGKVVNTSVVEAWCMEKNRFCCLNSNGTVCIDPLQVAVIQLCVQYDDEVRRCYVVHLSAIYTRRERQVFIANSAILPLSSHLHHHRRQKTAPKLLWVLGI